MTAAEAKALADEARLENAARYEVYRLLSLPGQLLSINKKIVEAAKTGETIMIWDESSLCPFAIGLLESDGYSIKHDPYVGYFISWKGKE